jgi:phage terminase small subunit
MRGIQANRALAEGDIQGVIDNLSEKQKRFCEEYLVDFNATAATVRAGYNTKYPNRMGSAMLQHAGIKACIDALTLQRASKSVLKPEYVTQKIMKTIEKAELDNNHAAVLRGCELLARHLGMFIERTEISGPNGDAIKHQAVREAADAFTSAVASLIERGGESGAFIVAEPGGSGRA